MKLFRMSSGSMLAAGALALTGVSLVLGGCASDKKEYVSDTNRATRGKSLEVPPDLIAPGRDERLQLPVAPGRATASTYNNDKKPEAQAGAAVSPDQMGKARIARAGSQRWLVMPGTPQVVWPQLRKFWEELGFTIQTDTPQLYVMETDWAEKRSKTGGVPMLNMPLFRAFISNSDRDKFRTRLETGSEPGMVEIYISHRALEETDLQDASKTIGWQTRAGDPGLELEMLRRVMIAFGSTEDQAKLAVAAPATADKARLANAADGALTLNVDDVVDRTWRQIGLGLDRVGMVVEDRDRAKGIYFVRYITDEDLGKKKDSGWFSWMAFWRSSDKKSDTDQFRIVVQPDGQKTTVRVQNKAGEAASAASSKQILTLLYNELK